MLIAEIGLSHLGSADRLMDIVHAARDSGCDAVKFQVYSAGEVSAWDDDGTDLRQSLQLPVSAYIGAAHEAVRCGLGVGASLFGEYGRSLVSVLTFLKVAARSFPEEPWLDWMFAQQLPVYVSCRRFLPATLPGNAVPMACSEYGSEELPAQALAYLKHSFRTFGYSSHSPASMVGRDCVEAAARGAETIEKHFCLKRSEIQIDAQHSLEPSEMMSLSKELKG